MPDYVEVAGITVTAPLWRGSPVSIYYNPYTPEYPNDPGSPAEMAAIKASQEHVKVSGVDLNDAFTKAMVEGARNEFATLHYYADMVSQTDPNRVIMTTPEGQPITAGQLLQILDRVTFNFTSANVLNGAQTEPSSLNSGTATFTININPADPKVHAYSTAFGGNAELGANYVVNHELGHASGQALSFIQTYAGFGTAAPDNALIEAYANSFGQGYATLVDVPYPSHDQLQGSYFGTLPDHWITGSDGDDVLTDGPGADFLVGGAGSDTLSMAQNGQGGTVNLTPATTYSSDVQAYVSIESVVGSGFDDTLTGAAGANTLSGGLGNDVISGGDGNDSIAGGDGDDLLQGNQGDDFIQANQGNDTAHGGQGNDTVQGGQGNDILFGDIGDDYVSSDKGQDAIYGGSGADTFNVTPDAGIDTIYDFNRAEGDHVRIQSGTCQIFQQGADTVLDFGNGTVTTLLNVNLSTLDSGWITYG